MSTTQGKSKRDLIWEEKKRAREQLLQNAPNNDAGNNNPPLNFAKKSPLYDNFEPEHPQQSKPLDNFDSNRGRKVQFQNEEEIKPASQPSNNPFQRHDYAQEQQSREPPQEIPSRNLQNQPNFSEYEPVINRNQPQNAFTEEPTRGQKVNFNPSYQPSMDYHEPVGRESRELGNGNLNDRKKKNDYAEELRNQMRQKEMQKQQEKNEIRSSMQRNNNNDDNNYTREVERKRKEQYGDFLKQQMQAKEEAKKNERQVDRKAQLVQSFEAQDYNPYGRGGAGAPLRDHHASGQKNPLLNNFPDQRQNMNQQAYVPQQQGYRDFQRQQPYSPQQQQMDSMQQHDRYQPQMQQQQQNYNNPIHPVPDQSNQMAGNNDRYLPRQSSLRGEKFTPGNQLQRSGTMEYGSVDAGSAENIDGPNYARGNTIETNERGGRRGLPLQSDDPQMLAKKDKMKQDFQKGLQEQIEYKKKMKELEKQKRLEEDRLEEERIRRENEEFERRQAEEDPRKRKAKPPVEQEQPQFVQQPKERSNRNRPNNQANPEPNSQFNSNPGPGPSNEGLQHPPPYYNPYNQPPPQQYPYPPPYNQAYNPLYPPPYNHPYPPQYHHPYPGPYGQPNPTTPPPYYNPQQPASFPSGKTEVVTSELQQIRSEIQNQQAVLSKQLELIKKEAMNVMEGRDKAERELLDLRGKLKDKMVQEQLYKQNLQNALDKNMQTRPQREPIKALHQDMNPSFDPYPVQEKPKRQLLNMNQFERGYVEFHEAPNLDKPSYNIRRTDQNLLNVQHDKFEDSYSPYLDHDRTLAGDTKMIPLEVFDNKMGGGNHLRVSNQDPLTLSKIHKYDMGPSYKPDRPNSSKQWNLKEEDSIDALIKGHGPLRPGSSESNTMGDTSRFIGKRLDEASMILKQGELGKIGKAPDRYGLKSRENDTLSLAGRNILGEKNINMNMRGGYGHKEGNLRGDEGIRMNITGTTDILPDLSMGPGMDHHDMTGHHSMNMTGTSFNVDKINLANEARLKKLENMGTGTMKSNQGYENTGARGNYYGNRGGVGGLESIQEDPDDHMAKIDKILGGYLKTHEDEEHQRNAMY